MIKDSTILFIGAGQIGSAACLEILKREPRTLILHTLTEEESNESLAWIREHSLQSKAELIPSSGDILVAFPGSDEGSLLAEIKYRFGTLTPELVKSAPLWKLIEKFQPDMIVDGINTATYVGYGHDPYSTSRELLQILETGRLPKEKDLLGLIRNSLLAEAIPRLIRFTQVLHLAMVEYHVQRYVKISTSGLGGMGFNIQYTHGDLGEPGCSPKLLGKVTAAGVVNQLLLTLSHTPGLDVKVIVPTALVGWKEITSEITQKTGGSHAEIPLVDCDHPLDFSQNQAFSAHHPINLGKTLKMVAVDSGENGYYALGDMTTITTLGQMGCISKEEVAYAIAESLEGSTRYDICAALDSACLGPSFKAAYDRHFLLSRMREMDQRAEFPSVSIGNLGPTVTKHLWELEILRLLCSSISGIIDNQPADLAARAEELILKGNVSLRRQILSLRMPILLSGNRFLLGAAWHVPPEKNPKNIKENIEVWAQEGWIDLRTARMKYWIQNLQQVADLIGDDSLPHRTGSDFNRQSLNLREDFDIGEVLGLIYSMNGGNRKML